MLLNGAQVFLFFVFIIDLYLVINFNLHNIYVFGTIEQYSILNFYTSARIKKINLY